MTDSSNKKSNNPSNRNNRTGEYSNESNNYTNSDYPNLNSNNPNNNLQISSKVTFGTSGGSNLSITPSSTNSNTLNLPQQKPKSKSPSRSNQNPLAIVKEEFKENDENIQNYDVEQTENLEYMGNIKKAKQDGPQNGKDLDSLEKSDYKITNALELSYSNKISEDSKENDSSYQGTERTKVKRRTQKKRTTIKGAYYTNLIKKHINRDDVLEQWRNIAIKTILSESKLKSKDLEEIMFQGELLKLSPLQNSTNAYFNKYYSPKFLVFTKTELR